MRQIYDNANRLMQSIGPLGTTTFSYDAKNRRTGMTDVNAGVTTYAWTDDNQLASVATPGNGSVTNTYNGDGLRFSRQDSSGTSNLLWDGNVLQAELTGGSVSTYYTQAHCGAGILPASGQFGDVISTRNVTAGTTSLPLYDAADNAQQTTNSTGAVDATLAYEGFGLLVNNTGPANPPTAWVGRRGYQYEPTLGPAGLQYLRQRWYDPATRQFISPDPLGFACGDYNLVRYAGNNPVNRNDPGGEQVEQIGQSLFWKVHSGETAWGIAHDLTGHGAWYRKVFRRPPGGFNHLHPGELLRFNPARLGLIWQSAAGSGLVPLAPHAAAFSAPQAGGVHVPAPVPDMTIRAWHPSFRGDLEQWVAGGPGDWQYHGYLWRLFHGLVKPAAIGVKHGITSVVTGVESLFSHPVDAAKYVVHVAEAVPQAVLHPDMAYEQARELVLHGWQHVGALPRSEQVPWTVEHTAGLLTQMFAADESLRALGGLRDAVRFRGADIFADSGRDYSMAAVRDRYWGGRPPPSRLDSKMYREVERMELSHTYIAERGRIGRLLPERLKNRMWNLKAMWAGKHALADPARYQFMLAPWKQANPLPGPMVRLWARMPVSHRVVVIAVPVAGGAGYVLHREFGGR